MMEENVEDCYEREAEQEKEEFLEGISKQVALLFNKVIYQITLAKDKQRKVVHNKVDSPQSKAIFSTDTKAETALPLKKQGEKVSDSDLNEMRNINIQYKQKQDKLDNKPKKPVSSFFLFYQQNSKDLAANGEATGTRVAQIVADAWNKLSPEQKQPYNDRANQDKERYKEEMDKYILSHSSQIDEIKRLKRMKNKKKRQINKKKDLEEGQEDEDDQDSEINMKIKGISQRQMKAAERKNYSHRPKAPVSSFFLYYQDEARNIAQQYGQSVGSRLARLASSIWKQMPKEGKVKYEQLAKIERQRYHQEMIQYRIDYPEEVQSRRKKISNNMKRTLRLGNEDIKQESDSSSSSLENLSDSSSTDSSPSSNSYISQDSLEIKKENDTIITKPPPKRQRKEKQDQMPHKPKGPVCSFFQFYHANMKEFMKKDPKDTQKDAGSEFVRRASTKWNTLTEEEKQPFHELAREDRQRYQKDMEEFKQNYPQEYEQLKIFNRNKQLKKKGKKLAKMDIRLQELDDDIILQ